MRKHRVLEKTRTKHPRLSTSYLGMLRNLAPFARPYIWLIILSLLLAIIAAGLAQVTPILMHLLVKQVTTLVASHANFVNGWHVLFFVSSVLFSKEIFALCITIGNNYLGERLKVSVEADLSNAAFSHLLSLDLAFFDEQKNEVGKVIKRVDRGAEFLATVIKHLFVDILPLLASGAAALVIMYMVSLWVGLTSTLVVLLNFFLSLKQAHRQKGVRRRIQDTHERRTAGMTNVFSALKLVKSFTREDFEISNHQRINQSLAQIEIQHHQVNHVFDGFKLFADQVGAIVVVSVTSIFILKGQLSISTIMLHLLLYHNITAPVQMFHRIYDETNKALAYGEGFFTLFETKPISFEPSGNPVKMLGEIEGEIEFRNVSFSYTPGQEVIHNLNLILPAKQTSALVGLSGAGKTTIANLISRLYDPDHGEINVDGINLQDYSLNFIRRSVGFVGEQTHIFPGSIFENIRYGNPDATDEEVIEAAKKAGLHDEVAALKNGYESPANKLSSGQMQLISIARVFLKNPPILVLDRPTANLDTITAYHIKSSLNLLSRNRTVLIISNDIASIIGAGMITVLKDGIVIGVGTHHSLYQANEHYRSIIDANIEHMNTIVASLMQISSI